MTGLASPDVPAVYNYLIVVLVGAFVARAHVNERLNLYPDRWAFLGAWLLFLAHAVVPLILFWFLDHTGALQDTSLFAALLVAFGYRALFAGSVQGVSLTGQTAMLWKPFQAWVDTVAERINDRQGRYLDRFAEDLRGDVTRDPDKLKRLETLALERSARLDELRAAIAQARAIPEEPVAQSRLFDRLWPNLKTSAPNDYGYLLYQRGLVSYWRRWWWLERGRAKLLTGLSLIGVVAVVGGVWLWAGHDPRGTTLWETSQRRYHHWRFLKSNSTERDRWRASEYFARELRAATPERAPALHVDALLRPLIRELRYPEVPGRHHEAILRLVAHTHAPHLSPYYVPDLIESLRTTNEVVRLNVHRTLQELQRADFPTVAVTAALAAWEPRKNDTPGQIDGHVRLWQAWWKTAQAVPR